MNDDTREKRRRELIPRVALLACLALVVVSLGMALRPVSPPAPAEPPFSEQARSAALTDTLRLRAAGEQLGRSTAGDEKAAVAGTVSLLTSQARALLVPGQSVPASLPAPARSSSAAASASPSDSPTASASVSPAASPPPATAAALATELAASASQRFADAAESDGGMARLLAAVGTAQLLQASSLAAAAGAPAPAGPDPAVGVPEIDDLSGNCPGATGSPSSSPAGASADQDSPAATLHGALAAIVRTELESVYGYQVALTRMDGDAAVPASRQLTRHESLATDAEGLSRVHCAPVPPREAGYTLAPDFLASPAAGLGALEASALTAYGDLVGLSDGQTRQWAISGLVGAARRSALWGAETGALPGLAADPQEFPELPEPSPTPSH
ncbi:ferritin-like domain-containing protein [Arthrobacter sp. Leaf69]|uniref:ferritin-like domain-containing protein n=1 Tax=Arthrobacter sp. Leaf69 TaxID=1736232 RepID=UPI0009E7374E|nr:ferritin-like domain-containing protein [Arthrobacter sp. Leaf69]